MTETNNGLKPWSYVHGELGDEAHKRHREALRGNPELQDAFDRIRLLDKQLRTLMPLTDESDDRLADRILQALDEEPTERGARTRPRYGLIRFPDIRGLLTGDRWRVPVGAAAALAASVLVLLGLPYRLRATLDWEQPEFVQIRYRGQAGVDRAARYTRQDAAICLSHIKRALYAAKPVTEPSAWHLQFRFQELQDGAFRIHLRGSDQAGEHLLNWTWEFANVDDVIRQVEAISRTVLEDVGAASGRDRVPGHAVDSRRDACEFGCSAVA